MMYDFSRAFYIIQNFGTHGNRLPDDLQLSPLREVSSRNECANQKQATQNKAKKFVIKDGILHYIAKDGILHYIAKEWMHIHNCFQKKEMQPIPLTWRGPHHQSYFPLRDRQMLGLVQDLKDHHPSKSNGIVTIAL